MQQRQAALLTSVAVTAAIFSCSCPGLAKNQITAQTHLAGQKIVSYQGFEQSYLFKELKLTNIKNISGYRIYKDENNNYGLALQVDKSGTITAERILPLAKVPSRAQSQGVLLFLMDFIYGDRSAISDPAASKELSGLSAQMATTSGVFVRGFHVLLAQDQWKIRTGFEIRTKAARNWDLLEPVSPNKEVDYVVDLLAGRKSQDNRQVSYSRPPKLEPKNVSGQSKIVQATQPVKLWNAQLKEWKDRLRKAQNNYRLALAKIAMLQQALEEKDKLHQQQVQQLDSELKETRLERDAAVSKLDTVEAPAISQQAVVPSVSKVQSASESRSYEIDPGSRSEQIMANVADFDAKWYRKNIERRLNYRLFPLTPPDMPPTVNISIDFTIMRDGLPTDIHVRNLGPGGLPEKVIQRAIYLVQRAAPFEPLLSDDIDKLKTEVTVSQRLQDWGLQNWGLQTVLSARYVEGPRPSKALTMHESI